MCRAVLEILLLSRAWQLVRAGVRLVPLQSKIFFTFFSGWKKQRYLLMHRDAFTHLYTIRCWTWCCFPSRNDGFLLFLARGQPSMFCSSTRANQEISMFLSLHQTSLEKSPLKTKKKELRRQQLEPARCCGFSSEWRENEPVSLRRNMAFFPTCVCALTIGL